MGKVRVHVTLPSGKTLVVPCDHRQTIGMLMQEINLRAAVSDIADLQVTELAQRLLPISSLRLISLTFGSRSSMVHL